MPDPSQRSVHLSSVPRRVYAAADGVFPHWRFLVVALSLSAEPATLVRMTQVRHYATRTAAGDRIGPVVQGTREMAPEQVVALTVQDGTACQPLAQHAIVPAEGSGM